METYIVTGPDGREFSVPVKAGGSYEDAVDYVKKAKYDIGTGGVGTGMLKSGAVLVNGVKDLVGAADEDDLAFLDTLERRSEGSTPAAVGEAIGDIAQYAVPGAAVTKMAKPAAGFLPLAMEAATMGSVGAARLPEEGKTRAETGVEDVAATLTGQALAKTLMKGVEGIRRTPAADALIEKGVRVTPGQASAGPLPKAVEYTMSLSPFMSRGVEQAKGRAIEDWSLVALREAAPVGMATKITEAGKVGNQQLKDAYDDAYTMAWAKADTPTADSLTGVFESANAGIDSLSKESANVLTKLRDNTAKYLENPTPAGLKDLDNKMRKAERSATSGATPSIELAEVVDDMRQQLRSSIGDEAAAAVRQVDSTYGNYLALRKGATGAKALAEGAIATPKDLMRGAKGVSSETRAFTGRAPMQEFAQQGIEVLEQPDPQALINMWRGVMMNTPTLVPLKTGGDMMLGQTTPQRAMQQISNSAVADALRKYGLTPGSVSAASGMYE